MANILLIGEESDATQRLRSIIVEHFTQAHTLTLKPRKASRVVRTSDQRLIIYIVPLKKEVDLTLITEIRSVAYKTPLLIYGRLTSLQTDMVRLLDEGVKGILSIDANKHIHIQAIDALMRGNSYVDSAVRFQALVNLYRP